jgi:sortase B
MKNGSMFGGLASFENRSFFEENETAVIFLENETYTLRFFAFMVIQPDDTLYGTAGDVGGRETEILQYVRDNARFYRDVGVTAQERIVTLSTCAYEFRGARMVLLARLEPLPD